MKKAKPGPKDRFTDQEKADALEMIRRRDLTIEQVSASLGVSPRTIRRWRTRLEQSDQATPLTGAERRRLKQLERENAELKLQLQLQKKLEAFSRRATR